MWRGELQKRDEDYFQGQIKKDDDLAIMLEGRDKAINESLVYRDQFWLNSLDSIHDKLKVMQHVQTDIGESIHPKLIEPRENKNQ